MACIVLLPCVWDLAVSEECCKSMTSRILARIHGSGLTPNAGKRGWRLQVVWEEDRTSPSFLTATRALEPGCMLYLGSYFSMSFQLSSARSAFLAASSLLNEHLALPHIVSEIHMLQGFVAGIAFIGSSQKPLMRTFC